MEPMLLDLAQRYPDLSRRIDFWETGTALPDLTDVVAILILLQDPLRDLYPACYEEVCELTRRARLAGVRVINPPEALSNSIKTAQSRLWLAAGIPTPRAVGYSSLEELLAIKEISFPAILRADLLHSQTRALVLRTSHDLRDIDPSRLPMPGSVSPLVDTRAGYRLTQPGTAWSHFYHKKRALVFGNHVRNNHVFFSESPIVGVKSSTFRHYRSVNPVRRWIANRACRNEVALDFGFYGSPPEHEEVLVRAAKALNLEFVAIDYSQFSDGRPILWECNPHFALHMWPFEILPRQRRLKQRLQSFHDTAHEFFLALLTPERT